MRSFTVVLYGCFFCVSGSLSWNGIRSVTWFQVNWHITHPYYECHKSYKMLCTSTKPLYVEQLNFNAACDITGSACPVSLCQSQRLTSQVYTWETFSGIDHDSSDIISGILSSGRHYFCVCVWHPVIKENVIVCLTSSVSSGRISTRKSKVY